MLSSVPRARRPARSPSLGSLATLGLAIGLLAGFDTGAAGLQHVTDVTWIPELGIHYQLGVDGLNLFLILLTALLWAGGDGLLALPRAGAAARSTT